jgi:hypothetical protein
MDRAQFSHVSLQPPVDDEGSRAEDAAEDAGIFMRWITRTFAQGPIPRGRIETVTVDLMRSFFFPGYRHWLLKDPRHTVKDLPKDDWWEGCKAISAIVARRLSSRIGAGLPAGAGVDFDTFWRMFEANTRGMFGPRVPHHPIPANWVEDPKYLEAQNRALRTKDDGDPLDHSRWALARLWDTFPIPLRYWTDSAALVLLNACLAVEKRPAIGFDTYRKDIRGNRSGLSLIPPANGKAVVTGRLYGPPIFRVHRDRARKHGLCLTYFPPLFPLADGTRLTFIFEG